MKITGYNIGYDGKSFFCMRCGKAGFKSEMAVRGHLSSCKGGRVKDMSAYFAWDKVEEVMEQKQKDNNIAGGGGAPAPAPAPLDEVMVLRREVQAVREDLNKVIKVLTNDVLHTLKSQSVVRGSWIVGLVKGLAGYILLTKTKKSDYMMKIIGIGLLGWGAYDIFGDAGIEKVSGVIFDNAVKSFAKAF